MEYKFNGFTDHKDIPKYEDKDGDHNFLAAAQSLIKQFDSFINNKIDKRTYQTNYATIGYIVRRVKRRLVQFEVFHEYGPGVHLPSELKEAALTAFWIVKLKPFSFLTELPKGCQAPKDYLRLPLNESFARYIIFCALQQTLKRTNPDEKYVFDESLKKTIDYAFRFWDFTKESFIFMVEGLYYQMRKMTMEADVA